MEKKTNLVRFGTAEDAAKFYPVSLAEGLRQLKHSVPLTAYGQARLEKAEREEAEARQKKSTASKKTGD
jgi:hypothetical protein